MQKHYNYLTIDLDKKVYRTLNAKQGDSKSRYILVNLISNNFAYDLTGTSVKIYGKKKDTTIFFNAATITDAKNGQFEIELTNQALAVPGYLKIEILVLGANQERLSTSYFYINVEETIIDDAAIESTNEFTALTTALSEVQNIDNRFAKVDEQFNTKASKDEVVKLQNSFNDIVLQNDLSPNKDVELVAMRTNVDGNTFNTATLRIEDIEKKVKSLPIFTKLHHFNVKPTNSSSNFLMLVYDSSVINKFTDRTLLKDSILNIELEFKNKNFQDGGFVDFQIFQGATNGTDFETAKGYCYASPNLILNTNNVYSYSAKINTNTTIYTNYYMKLFIRFNNYVANSNVEFTIKDISLAGISLMDLIKVNASGATLNSYECELVSNETQQIDTEQLKSEIMSDVDNRIATITPLACRWTGKRYASIGDSMTWQNGQTGLGSTNYTDDGTAMKGYQYYLNEKIGFSSFTNLGLSGQCLTMYDGETSASFMSRYTAYNYTNYDIITIMLGTNDYGRFGGLPIGTIDSTNIREFYGAYNTAISYMLTQNPKLKIILMTPFKRQGGENNNTAGFKLSDYAKAVKNIAEKWGLDCFDFYNRCGWNDKTFSTYTVDGLHFHQKGSDFSSPPFVNFVFNS